MSRNHLKEERLDKFYETLANMGLVKCEISDDMIDFRYNGLLFAHYMKKVNVFTMYPFIERVEEDGKLYYHTKQITKNLVLYDIEDFTKFKFVYKNKNKKGFVEEIGISHIVTLDENHYDSILYIMTISILMFNNIIFEDRKKFMRKKVNYAKRKN